MSWVQTVWLVIGILLGLVHAGGIWRTAKHPSAMSAAIGMARVVAVALALAAAAVLGGILPAAAGWTIGFFGGIGIIAATRLRINQRKATP